LSGIRRPISGCFISRGKVVAVEAFADQLDDAPASGCRFDAIKPGMRARELVAEAEGIAASFDDGAAPPRATALLSMCGSPPRGW
jgi:hypothetical protein